MESEPVGNPVGDPVGVPVGVPVGPSVGVPVGVLVGPPMGVTHWLTHYFPHRASYQAVQLLASLGHPVKAISKRSGKRGEVRQDATFLGDFRSHLSGGDPGGGLSDSQEERRCPGHPPASPQATDYPPVRTLPSWRVLLHADQR